MSRTTPRREAVLHAIREERARQIRLYGPNDDLLTGFAGSVTPYPWLLPYSDADSAKIEVAFRADYEQYKRNHGTITWAHLIREEVAELFATEKPNDVVVEAIQVAALCTSLVENMLRDAGRRRP